MDTQALMTAREKQGKLIASEEWGREMPLKPLDEDPEWTKFLQRSLTPTEPAKHPPLRGAKRVLDIFGSFVILAGMVYAGWLFHSTEQDTEQATAQRDPTIAEWLDACSPFESLDGARSLDFNIRDHSVELSEAIDQERAAGAIAAKHPKVTQGSWSADETTKQVVTDIDAAKSRYVLITTFSQDQCILAVGDAGSSDLRSSWFGTPDLEGDTAEHDPGAPKAQTRADVLKSTNTISLRYNTRTGKIEEIPVGSDQPPAKPILRYNPESRKIEEIPAARGLGQ
jgi:hypothetical protein